MQTEKWKQIVGLGIILVGAGNASLLLGQGAGIPQLGVGPLGLGIVLIIAGLTQRPRSA